MSHFYRSSQIAVRTGFAVVAAGLCIGLVACASQPEKPVDPVKSSLEKMLVEVDSMPRHSSSAEAPAPAARLNGSRVTIRNYVGDASNLLGRLAKARDMRFIVNGPQPHLPLLVTIDVESVSFEDFLNQVSFQFGQRADLVLGDNHLEIRYRGQP